MGQRMVQGRALPHPYARLAPPLGMRRATAAAAAACATCACAACCRRWPPLALPRRRQVLLLPCRKVGRLHRFCAFEHVCRPLHAAHALLQEVSRARRHLPRLLGAQHTHHHGPRFQLCDCLSLRRAQHRKWLARRRLPPQLLTDQALLLRGGHRPAGGVAMGVGSG